MGHSEIHKTIPLRYKGCNGVVIPHLEGLNGNHPEHLGPVFLCLVVLGLTVGMASWCGVFPICIGTLDVGSPLFSLVSHFSLQYYTNQWGSHLVWG